MTERKLTVSYMPGDGKHYPMIRLQGKWLEELGFKVGDRVVVSANAGGIVINKSEGASSPAQLTLYPMV
jgi:formylmethanofuran dehydrogenase subunit D